MLSKVWAKYGEEHASNSKAYSRFYNAMKTDSTVSTYTYNMKRFMDFLTANQEIKINQHNTFGTGFEIDYRNFHI
jgi:hypothetical protein